MRGFHARFLRHFFHARFLSYFLGTFLHKFFRYFFWLWVNKYITAGLVRA